MQAGYCFAIFCRGLNIRRSQVKQRTGKKRKEITALSLASGLIFAILALIFTGIPEHLGSWVDFIVMVMLFVFIHFLINFISLRKSFRKNQDLLDD